MKQAKINSGSFKLIFIFSLSLLYGPCVSIVVGGGGQCGLRPSGSGLEP